MEKEKHLDKLVTVSKIFVDARITHLRTENENLRLQLFWKDHNVQAMEKVIREANTWDKSPKCNCWKCAVTGRMDDDAVIDEPKQCDFIPWFEQKIAACGLISGFVLGESERKTHISNTLNGVWDVDCHFVKIPMMGGDWSGITYGSKLWKAQTANDPELKKLEMLFEMIGPDELSDE